MKREEVVLVVMEECTVTGGLPAVHHKQIGLIGPQPHEGTGQVAQTASKEWTRTSALSNNLRCPDQPGILCQLTGGHLQVPTVRGVVNYLVTSPFTLWKCLGGVFWSRGGWWVLCFEPDIFLP